jgi:hypothetical protein
VYYAKDGARARTVEWYNHVLMNGM